MDLVSCRARYCSCSFLSNLAPKLVSIPPLNMLFLMSCWVMVLPPPRFSPVNTPTAAREIERRSMPLWVQKRESSMATNALIRSLGSSSNVASSRFEPAVTRVSVKLPALSYTVVAYPMGTMLSTLSSGALSMIPMIMPMPMLDMTRTQNRQSTQQVFIKVRKIRERYLSLREFAACRRFSVASFP